jgi:RHS repeat-associated protein
MRTGFTTAARITSTAAFEFTFKVALLMLLLGGAVRAQDRTTMPTDGATPSGVAPGAPAGSFALSGFDNVNLYNGNLNFALPMLGVNGRGGARYGMTLKIEQKWVVKTSINDQTGQKRHYPSPDWWEGRKPGYGPGVLQGRKSGNLRVRCPSPPVGETLYKYSQALTRLTFTTGDGTEFEFRDQLNNGQPLSVPNCTGTGSNRGRFFITADGTSATFISDSDIFDYGLVSLVGQIVFFPSGYLMLRDGARYRIDNGLVSWMRDRNGNRLTFTYDSFGRVTSVTDSLNRQVTVAYGVSDVQPYGLCDQISYKGAGGASRMIRVSKTNLGSALRAGFALQTPGQLFEQSDGTLATVYDPTVVSSLWLPDGNRRYQFSYNSYGELARIVLPTGGAIEYDHAPGLSDNTTGGFFNLNFPVSKQIYRRVLERRVYADGTTLESRQTYSRPENSAGDNLGYVIMDHLDAGGALLARQQHYFYGSPRSSFGGTPVSYSNWKEGREYKTESFDANGVTLLHRSDTTWQQPVDGSTWPLTQPETLDSARPNNPQITQTTTTLLDTNQVAMQTFSYDSNNNQTDVWEYDFGPGAPPAYPTRHTHADYLTSGYDTNTDIHLRDLLSQRLVYAVNTSTGAETLASHITYEYDLYDNSTKHAPLVDRPGISELDSGFTTGYTTRGNVTKVGRWLDTPSSWIYTYAQYDIAGNVVKAIDGNGNATTLDFSDRYGSQGNDAEQNAPPPELNGQTSYAFATKVTNALNHTAYTKYDYYLGKSDTIEDANGIVSSVAYDDALDRPTQGIQARYKVGVGVPAERRQTTITYDDTNHVITSTGDRDAFGDNLIKSEIVYDGLGRTVEARTYAPGPAGCSSPCYSLVKTTFDAMGRTYQVSNPYWNHETPIWTTTQYDALSRVTSVTTPDGATVSTAYNGAQVTVTDQAGKKRRSITDALGRLAKVVEDPDGVGYQTDYSYDTLGNLTVVNQGGQFRYFFYDSLGHLTRAKNPEQSANSSLNLANPPAYNNNWSTAYSYDDNGNLTQRIDARGIETKYYYDALNRNWGIDYINGTQKSNVVRVFDGAVNGKGRLYWNRTQEGGTQEMGTNVTNTSIDSYDALGRPLQYRQHFWQASTQWGPGYYFHQTYDLAGNLKTLTYPSGHIANYTYDQVRRLSSFSGNLGGSPATYADTIGYNPAGQILKERFGTNTSLYHNQHYNNRLQLVDTRLGDTNNEWSWSHGAINFFYGTTAANSWNLFASDTDNNGNLRRQDHFVPLASGGYVTPQDDVYTYDELNRVSSFTEAQIDSGGQSTNVASQNFIYDRWGNKKITSVTGGLNNYNPTYDTTNNTNRIVGLGYDAAGNITSDPMTGGLMTYDPENRMLTATNGGVSGSYTYDADGRRVKRIVGGVETWQIYGIGGELLAEYAAGAAASAPQKEYGYRGGQLLVIAEPWSGGNLAWGKATSQSSTSFGGESSRGVDGNTSGNWGDNSVSHTNSEHQPWWQVDLGSVQQIGTVRLWNRTDCCSERLSNFYVLVSDNPFSSTDLTTTINQAGVSSYYTAGPAGLLTEKGVGRSGRYVRVQLAGDNYLSLAEVEVMGGTVSGEGVKWLVQDHLGSTRMVVDRSGSLAGIRRHDFLPFGEELGAGIGIRSAALGYGADSTRQKFTGYERDDETGLDFAQARYYASVQGRFTSVDPLMASATVRNPQTWNRYAYVLNNPLALVDPDGMKEISVEDCRKDSKCIVVDVNVIYDKTANKGAGLTDKQKEKFNKQLLQHAKDTYGVANIALNVTHTEAEFTRNGISGGVVSSAINVVVTTDLRGVTGDSGFSLVDKKTGNAFSFVDIDHRDTTDALLSHEIAHHFAGDTTGNPIGYLGPFANPVADTINNTNISLLRLYDYTGQAKGNGYYTEYSIAGASKLPSSRQVKAPFYDSARKFQQHLLNNVPRK